MYDTDTLDTAPGRFAPSVPPRSIGPDQRRIPAGTTLVPVGAIRFGLNTRREFAEEPLAGLADSIAQQGLLIPPIVREADGQYQLVAGERRIRAMRDVLGWQEVPVIISRSIADDLAAYLAMATENITREPFAILEEADTYRRGIEEHGLPLDELARHMGKQPHYISGRIALLALPEELQEALSKGILTIGYANELCTSMAEFADPADGRNFARVAFAKLREQPAPTLVWWRDLLGDLVALMQQASLEFGVDLDATTTYTALAELAELPPAYLPGTIEPDIDGDDAATALLAEADFWREQADAWRRHPGGKTNQLACLKHADSLDLAAEVAARFNHRELATRILITVAERLTAQGVSEDLIVSALDGDE